MTRKRPGRISFRFSQVSALKQVRFKWFYCIWDFFFNWIFHFHGRYSRGIYLRIEELICMKLHICLFDVKRFHPNFDKVIFFCSTITKEYLQYVYFKFAVEKLINYFIFLWLFSVLCECRIGIIVWFQWKKYRCSNKNTSFLLISREL